LKGFFSISYDNPWEVVASRNRVVDRAKRDVHDVVVTTNRRDPLGKGSHSS
jgi:hypothetical protein